MCFLVVFFIGVWMFYYSFAFRQAVLETCSHLLRWHFHSMPVFHIIYPITRDTSPLTPAYELTYDWEYSNDWTDCIFTIT